MQFSRIELAVTLGFIGLFGFAVSHVLGAYLVVAFRDPGMQVALDLHP